MIKNTAVINININYDTTFTIKEYYNRRMHGYEHLDLMDLIHIELAYNTEQVKTKCVSSKLAFTEQHEPEDSLFNTFRHIIMHSELKVAEYNYISIEEKISLFVFAKHHNLYIDKTTVYPDNNVIMPALSIMHFWNNNYSKQKYMKSIYEVIKTIFMLERRIIEYNKPITIEENAISEQMLKDIKNTIEQLKKHKYEVQLEDIKKCIEEDWNNYSTYVTELYIRLIQSLLNNQILDFISEAKYFFYAGKNFNLIGSLMKIFSSKKDLVNFFYALSMNEARISIFDVGIYTTNYRDVSRYLKVNVSVESIYDYTVEPMYYYTSKKKKSCRFNTKINARPQTIKISYKDKAYQPLGSCRIEIKRIVYYKLHFFIRNSVILSLVCSHAKNVKNRAVKSYDVLKNIQNAEGLLCNCVFI